MTKKYSVKIGCWKAIKNTLIVAGIPAVLVFLDNLASTDLISENPVVAPILGAIAYFVKNYLSNK